MTLPALTKKKFYIIKPKEATNQIKNPAFALPDGKEDWVASGAGVTIADTTTFQRRGSNAMQANPATGVASGAYHPGLTVVSGLAYTFSCDVKGVDGQAMRIYIADVAGTVKATKTFVATGYWQRVEVTHTAAASIATYRVYVIRDAVASTAAYYVDGCQFEQASKASTFITGDETGCRWTGLARNSSSIRSEMTRYGGELIDLDDYCFVESITGLGHGDWNQILTKMTSGGSMYQGHIRKSRQFSMIIGIKGANMGAIEASRKALIDALRPDLLEGQEMILRYQGLAANGDEVTNPIDIVCVPLSGTLMNTPKSPTFQKEVLNFSIPSGLLAGAYEEGWSPASIAANFPAEYIVKRDLAGNWCTWNGSTGASLITGLNGVVYCMAEGPDGKIYVGGNFTTAGGVANASFLARWNGAVWEVVVAGINNFVYSMAFDANGDLYIGGGFTALGSVNGNRIVKITDLNGTPTVNAMGAGCNDWVRTIVVSPTNTIYAGGAFTLAGGVSNTIRIAKWDGTTWSALATGLNALVYSMAFAPNGNLYIGGQFTNADGTYGDYLCYWNGTAFVRVGTVELNSIVYSLIFDSAGSLFIGGFFTAAGGNTSANYIARWNGTTWSALGMGVNNSVYVIYINNNLIYVGGIFTSAGGLVLTDRIAVWANGAWQAIDADLPGVSIVRSFLFTLDGALYVGGEFSTVFETPDVNAFCSFTAPASLSASANTFPTAEIIGPGVLKGLANNSTGSELQFEALTLLAGERLTLKLDPTDLQFTSSWSGRGNVMRYVIAGSDYGNFYLKPGANNISLFMSATTAASKASITWKPRFWGLDGALL